MIRQKRVKHMDKQVSAGEYIRSTTGRLCIIASPVFPVRFATNADDHWPESVPT
jgi:hypothetical protein